jgi:hypothetical protein
MLYTFQNLANKLTQLGYPESTESGFRVIKRDFTQEEKAGNIEFRQDGVYLTIDGQEYEGYMYLKFADITRYGLPKFHITNCQTILEQRASGRFDGRYFWHNSNSVSIQNRCNGEIHEGVILGLCNYCRTQSSISEYIDTEGFFSLLDKQEQEEINQEYEVDIFGYTLDWQKISRQFRVENKYTCESCGIVIEIPADRRFIHVHHKSGNKLNNKRNNLEGLCVLCHANKDKTHEHNFQRRRMQAEIKAFVDMYRDKLIELNNIYLDR